MRLYYNKGINKGNLKKVIEVETIEEVEKIWKNEIIKPTVWQDGKRLSEY